MNVLKKLIPVLVAIVLVMVPAQPLLASQTEVEPQMVASESYCPAGGETKVTTWMFGFKLYLSQSDCIWLGTGLSVSAITAFLLTAGGIAIIYPILPAVALALGGLGAAFFTMCALNPNGVILYFFWLVPIPLPPMIFSQAPCGCGGSGGLPPDIFLR